MMSGFQTLFDSIENKKHGLEVMLSELSPTELSLCPGPQRWSIQMILEHIIIMEEIIVREMEERLKNKSVEWDAKLPLAVRRPTNICPLIFKSSGAPLHPRES